MDTSDRHTTARWLRDLSVPLVVAVVAGVLTAYLLPRILERAENHRKAKELQTALAQEMGHATAAAISTAQLLARGVVAKEQQRNGQDAFNSGLQDWKTASAAIGTTLDAYFSARSNGVSLSGQWDAYSRIVEDVYFLSGTGLKRERCVRTRAVRSFLQPGSAQGRRCPQTETERAAECTAASSTQWDLVAACDGDDVAQYGYARKNNFREAYVRISNQVLRRGRDLIREMLALTPSGF